MSILEAGMMICFGASWPFQVVKTYKTKEIKGKSILFLWLVEVGYVLGMLHHIFYAPDRVILLYLLNFTLVGADIFLYYKYKNLQQDRAKTIQYLNLQYEKVESGAISSK